MNDMITKTTPAQEAPETEGWQAPKSRPSHLAEPALVEWQELTEKVREIAIRCSLNKTTLASRAGMALPTFSAWYDGNYAGNYANQATRVRAFLRSQEEAIATNAAAIQEPGWVETETARKVMAALSFAQQTAAMTAITLGSGMGKSTCARHYVSTYPNAYRVVLRPSTASVSAVVQAVAKELGVTERDPAKLPDAIGEKVKRNGKRSIILLDEAQWASEKAVNEVRYWLDEYGCGLALLGNDDVFTRFVSTAGPGTAQIHSRTGPRLRLPKPSELDLEIYVAAWSLQDADAARLAKVIGRKPGALRQISETLRLAAIFAAGHGRQITADDVREAWMNRGGEEVR